MLTGEDGSVLPSLVKAVAVNVFNPFFNLMKILKVPSFLQGPDATLLPLFCIIMVLEGIAVPFTSTSA